MNSLADPRVVSLGEALVDLIGDAHAGYRGLPGGSPLNAAVAAARLGTPTAMLTRFSADAFGALLRMHLEAAGVDLRWAERGPEPTSLAVVTLDEQGRAGYGFYRAETADVSYDPRPRPVLPSSVRVGNVTVSLLRPPAREALREVVASHGRGQDAGQPSGASHGRGQDAGQPRGASHGRGQDAGQPRGAAPGRVTWVLDPNARPALWDGPEAFARELATWVPLVDVVKASDEDLAYLGGDETGLAAAWLDAGVAAVVVTAGPDGARLHRRGRQVLEVPGRRVAVVDTVGAGDTFTAGLTTGLVDGPPPAELDDARWSALLRRAVAASSITCTRAGADPPTAAELAAVLAGDR